MVETRAQAARRAIWEEMENRPIRDMYDEIVARYRDNDHSHRHRLPDAAPYEVEVETHKRRRPN